MFFNLQNESCYPVVSCPRMGTELSWSMEATTYISPVINSLVSKEETNTQKSQVLLQPRWEPGRGGAQKLCIPEEEKDHTGMSPRQLDPFQLFFKPVQSHPCSPLYPQGAKTAPLFNQWENRNIFLRDHRSLLWFEWKLFPPPKKKHTHKSECV